MSRSFPQPTVSDSGMIHPFRLNILLKYSCDGVFLNLFYRYTGATQEFYSEDHQARLFLPPTYLCYSKPTLSPGFLKSFSAFLFEIFNVEIVLCGRSTSKSSSPFASTASVWRPVTSRCRKLSFSLPELNAHNQCTTTNGSTGAATLVHSSTLDLASSPYRACDIDVPCVYTYVTFHTASRSSVYCNNARYILRFKSFLFSSNDLQVRSHLFTNPAALLWTLLAVGVC